MSEKEKDKIKKEENKKIEELREQCENFENKYKRALADYTNLQKRTEEEKKRFVKFANEVLMQKFLEVLDDLEESQKHIKDEGINKVIEKFKKTLTDQGVEEIEAKGQSFDPNLHEAIESVNGEDGKIIKVHRKGYMFHEKPLRPAIVAVGNGQKE